MADSTDSDTGQSSDATPGGIASSPTQTTSKTCHLLRLPGELRNRIYELVDEPQPQLGSSFFVEISDYKACHRWKVEPKQPPLASTCKQIRHEVLAIFLGSKMFMVGASPIERMRRNPHLPRACLWYLRWVQGLFWVPGVFVHKYVVSVGVRVSEGGKLELVGLEDNASRYCKCVLADRIRKVEDGKVGSRDDAPVVRFFKSWDENEGFECHRNFRAENDRTYIHWEGGPRKDCETGSQHVCYMHLL
ncbi:uncharacterized protein LTR77_007803 [Saxophila tyrrhenica]|uniref:Uncharacterized protein n=1 Tax=Saxophila tyrrhenica TaxID=1690608 RepID=A0AAV9P3T1_9PEZI|nr:hypothetical protein LTR77_007803 [Saxophila tyrrhenica]